MLDHHIDTIEPIKLILWIIELNPKAQDNVQEILTNTLSSILEKHKKILNHITDKKESNQLLGEAVLFSAVKGGNAGMVKLLLQHNVKHNCYDEEGCYPLHRATETRNIDVAKFLLDDGANVDAQTSKLKQTPLLWAAYKDNLKLVQLLIEKGADINYQALRSETALHNAILARNFKIAEWLLGQGADINLYPPYDHILCTAVESGNNYIVKKLIEKHVDVNAKKVSASVKNSSDDKSFPLFIAVNKVHSSVITTLLESGANPNLENNNNFSLLHGAILMKRNESVDIAKTLILHGADINAQDKWGNTPLHCAKSIAKIELLLDWGARTTIKNNRKLLPLDQCKANLENKKWENEETDKTLEEVIKKYHEKPRSLTLLTKFCIRNRLIKSTSDTSNTKTFKQKIAELGLPKTLKSYVESASEKAQLSNATKSVACLWKLTL